MRQRILLPIWVASAAVASVSADTALAEDTILFTANQDFLSRIYVLNMNGHVLDYAQFDFYRWVGMEVVDGELYVADAFAPRVYKVDPATWDLEVFIDDWSLFYFYDVAFDGTYFYVDEWDLNRYDRDGDYAGTAGFDENVLGCAWDGEFLYTLDDTDLIKCWDLSGWPTVVQVPDRDFPPPSAQCRGLFFDGEYFWSAESGDVPGKVYRFDHAGTVIAQWNEPAFSGWGAALLRDPATAVSPGSPDVVFELQRNCPNPFRPTTRIRFCVPETDFVELTVYDVQGRKVETLLSAPVRAGSHEVPWSAHGLAGGVYWARLEAGGRTETRKMVLLR